MSQVTTAPSPSLHFLQQAGRKSPNRQTDKPCDPEAPRVLGVRSTTDIILIICSHQSTTSQSKQSLSRVAPQHEYTTSILSFRTDWLLQHVRALAQHAALLMLPPVPIILLYVLMLHEKSLQLQ